MEKVRKKRHITMQMENKKWDSNIYIKVLLKQKLQKTKRTTLPNDQVINTRRYNNSKCVCTQHKANINRHKRKSTVAQQLGNLTPWLQQRTECPNRKSLRKHYI